MNSNSYLNQLLEEQLLTEDELKELTNHRDEVEKCLRDDFGEEPIIKYAGSRVKGTMIKESYDLDIVCYFPSDFEDTIKEIYESIKEKLAEKYAIEAKTSAIRIGKKSNGKNLDYHIDVVPGKFQDDSDDVFLYVSSTEGERIQTNINKHFGYITNSGCQEIIKLVKLWKVRNGLQIRTFVLEMAVVEALNGFKNKSDLEAAFKKVLEFLRDEIETIQLVDPANTNNIVSNQLTSVDKSIISSTAQAAFNIIGESIPIDETELKEIFKNFNNRSTPIISVKQEDVPRPWSQ